MTAGPWHRASLFAPPIHMKRFGLSISAIILIPLSLLMLSWLYTQLWFQRHPAPGRLVDVGGYRLHLNCTGAGRSTVMLEAGLGDSSLIWRTVQGAVSQFARVCSYDRAGFGWSDPSPLARTPMNETSELHELLKRADLGRVVLVGHSFGGDLVNLYADRFPEDLAGVVIVEGSNEDRWSDIPGLKAQWVDFDQDCQRDVWKARLGWALFDRNPAAEYPASVARIAGILNHFPKSERATCEETRSIIGVGMKQIAAARRPRKVPAIIVTGGENLFEQDAALSDRVHAGEVWKDLQRQTAQMFDPGVQVIAAKSRHYVQYDEPGVVVSQIRRLVDGNKKGRDKLAPAAEAHI